MHEYDACVAHMLACMCADCNWDFLLIFHVLSSTPKKCYYGVKVMNEGVECAGSGVILYRYGIIVNFFFSSMLVQVQ